MCDVFMGAPELVKAELRPILAEMSLPSMIGCCAELDGRVADLRLRAEIRRWVCDNCLHCETCRAA